MKWTEEDLALITELRRCGKSFREIGQVTDRSENAVRNKLIRENLGNLLPRAEKFELSEEQIDIALALMLQGRTTKEIACELGVLPEQLNRYLFEEGIVDEARDVMTRTSLTRIKQWMDRYSSRLTSAVGRKR